MKKLEEQQPSEVEHGISRRDVLFGLGAAAATLAISENAIAAMPGHDHSKHSAQQPAITTFKNIELCSKQLHRQRYSLHLSLPCSLERR